MKSKCKLILIILIFISAIGTILIYPKLPNMIPTHWNFSGEVDTYSDKTSILWLSGLPLFIFIFMDVMPRIDPKRKNYVKHKTAYNVSIFLTTLILIIFNWLSILFSLNFPIKINLVANILIGTLFIVTGNFMPQIRHNYFFGIKSPWCLSSETVWRKTHQLGGLGFIASGIIFIANAFISNKFFSYFALGFVLFVSFGLYLYSYIIFKKENRNNF